MCPQRWSLIVPSDLAVPHNSLPAFPPRAWSGLPGIRTLPRSPKYVHLDVTHGLSMRRCHIEKQISHQP